MARSLVAGLVLLLGALLVPVATAGWWVRDTIVPTSSYVDTVAPLATNDAVVAAVEDRLVARVMASVDSSGVVDRATTALGTGSLPPQVADRLTNASGSLRTRVERLVRLAVTRVVADPAFAEAWRTSNEVAHEQLVAILTGDSDAVSVGSDRTVDLRLATLATAIRQELIDADVPFAAAIPQVQATFPIGNADDLAKAQRAYMLLDRWGRLLPLAALLVVLLGVVVARHRRRALGWTALLSLVGLGVVAVGLLVGRGIYLERLPSGISRPAAEAFFDTLTDGLRRDLLYVAVGAVVVLVVTAVRLPRRRSADD